MGLSSMLQPTYMSYYHACLPRIPFYLYTMVNFHGEKPISQTNFTDWTRLKLRMVVDGVILGTKMEK